MSSIIQKRKYLLDNMDWLLDLLAYYRAWSPKMQTSKSAQLWTKGQKESECKVNEVTR